MPSPTLFTLTLDDPSFIIHDPSYVGVQSTAEEITADAASQRGARVISSADIIRFCVKINDTKHSKAGGTAWKSGPVTIVEKSHKTPPDFAALPRRPFTRLILRQDPGAN